MNKEIIIANKLPTKHDFYFDGGEDEKYALELFLGKSIDEVVAQCKANTPLALADIFYHTGTKAFMYYVFAFLDYIKESIETQDDEMLFESVDLLSCILNIIEQNLDKSPDDFSEISIDLIKYLKFIKKNYQFLNVNEDIYGNLKNKIDSIMKKVRK